MSHYATTAHAAPVFVRSFTCCASVLQLLCMELPQEPGSSREQQQQHTGASSAAVAPPLARTPPPKPTVVLTEDDKDVELSLSRTRSGAYMVVKVSVDDGCLIQHCCLIDVLL